MSEVSRRNVHKRCVLYVSGFDPKGAAHYHAMLRTESTKQASRFGWSMEVHGRKRDPSGDASWQVSAVMDGQSVQTDMVFLRWDDIVRNHWPKSTMRLWTDVIRTTVYYVATGALWRMYRLSWPPVVALLMPFLLVMLLSLGAPILAWLVGWGLVRLGAGLVVAACGTGVTWWLCWWIGRSLEARYGMYWMMRSYAFTARQARIGVPELEQRLNEHADKLIECVVQGQYDEVLLVGHSSGANMAASVLARALSRRPDLASGTARTGFLTLGQWLPLMGCLPVAHGFRAELKVLADAKGVTWIDFSAPPDGCCFALCDPFAACGVIRGPEGVSFKLLNPKFADMFDPAAYAALKQDRFRTHFQYLCASDKSTDYDFFQIVAGPAALADRYADSPGVTGYTALRGAQWLWRLHPIMRFPRNH